MKVRTSIKKRSEDCKIVKRKGRLYVVWKSVCLTVRWVTPKLS